MGTTYGKKGEFLLLLSARLFSTYATSYIDVSRATRGVSGSFFSFYPCSLSLFVLLPPPLLPPALCSFPFGFFAGLEPSAKIRPRSPTFDDRRLRVPAAAGSPRLLTSVTMFGMFSLGFVVLRCSLCLKSQRAYRGSIFTVQRTDSFSTTTGWYRHCAQILSQCVHGGIRSS